MSYTKAQLEQKLRAEKHTNDDLREKISSTENKLNDAYDAIGRKDLRISELESELAKIKQQKPQKSPEKPGMSPECKKLLENTQPRESVIQVDAILAASEQHESRLMRTVHELAEARQQGHVSTDFSSDDDTDSDDFDDEDCEGDIYAHGWNGEYLDPDELLGDEDDTE